MLGVGEDELLEVLARVDERVGDLEGGGGVDVVVVLPGDEEEFAFEEVGVDDVGAFGVPGAEGPTHELLVPPEAVEAVVVAAAEGDGGLVEVVVPQEGGHGVLPARGPAVDAHALQIHPGAVFGRRLHPEDAVGEAGVAEVAPADVVEGLGAAEGAHAVDAHHDEAQGGEHVGEVIHREEGGGELVDGRPRVDLLDDGVLPLGVEVRGQAEDAPDVGLAVAPLGADDLRHLPAGGLQGRDVLALQLGDDGAVGGAPQEGHVRAVGARGVVHEDRAVGRERHVVVGVLGREVAPARAVERGHAEVHLIGAFLGVDPAGGEPHLPGGLVHPQDLVHHEGALRQRRGAPVGVKAPQLPPACPLRHPQRREPVREVTPLARYVPSPLYALE